MDGVVARVKALPWARMLLLAALAVTLVYWTLVVIQSVGMVSPRGSDFAFYELAATALRFDPHANIYSAQTLANTLQAHGGCFPFQHAPYIYPPLLAILLEPLAGSSCATATTVWDLVNVVFWLLATALLIDLLRRRWPGRQLLATALVVAASFASWHMMWGFWLDHHALRHRAELLAATAATPDARWRRACLRHPHRASPCRSARILRPARSR